MLSNYESRITNHDMYLIIQKHMENSTAIAPENAAKWVGIGVLIVGGVLLIRWFYKKLFRRFKPRNVPLPTAGKGIPIYSDGTVWSPLKSVEMLYQAMHGEGGGEWWNLAGWGTDEDTIFLVLGDKTQDQIAAILNAYEEKYERDLIADFSAEMSGRDLSTVLDFFAFIRP